MRVDQGGARAVDVAHEIGQSHQRVIVIVIMMAIVIVIMMAIVMVIKMFMGAIRAPDHAYALVQTLPLTVAIAINIGTRRSFSAGMNMGVGM
jgi:hypothetical protein